MYKQDLITWAIIGAVFFAVSTITYAVLHHYYSITNHGNIVTIGVLVVDANDILITHTEWGSLEPGSQADQLVYIKNNGSDPITLALATQDWNPLQAQNHITLSWNYTSTILNPQDKIPTILTLSISSEITGIIDFQFTSVITATGA